MRLLEGGAALMQGMNVLMMRTLNHCDQCALGWPLCLAGQRVMLLLAPTSPTDASLQPEPSTAVMAICSRTGGLHGKLKPGSGEAVLQNGHHEGAAAAAATAAPRAGGDG